MIEHYPWGTFDPVGHVYRDDAGIFVPGTTQIIKEQGLGVDLTMVDPEYLLWKSRIGTDVHYLSDVWDRDGEINPTWLTGDTEGYFESWVGFRRVSGFVPERSSWRHLASVNGLRFGMQLDKMGKVGRYPALLDLKCSDMNPPAWGYQTAAYEMGERASPRCGRYLRAAVRLYKDGRPGMLREHTNHENDAQQFLCALANLHERIRIGTFRIPG